MNSRREQNELSPALRAYLETTPAVSERNLADLREAGRRLDEDPAFQADYLKSLFVEKILAAMEDNGVNQAELAKRWGKTRQYLSKLLNENRRVNFTVETMCELAHLLGKRIELQVLGPSEAAHVVRPTPLAGHRMRNGRRDKQRPERHPRLSRAA